MSAYKTQKHDSKPDGDIAAGAARGNMADQVSSLDYWTLNDTTALKNLLDTQPSGSNQWCWTVTDFGQQSFEVTGAWMHQKPYKVKTKKRKQRKSTSVSEMTDADINRTLSRTKKVIRHKVKLMQANQLITCTTRKPIVETQQFTKIVQRFLRTLRKEFDNFQYLGVFERHMSEKTSQKKFGSLHFHMAVSGFVNYNVIRHAWRHAVQLELKDGDYEGANIDASGPRRKNGKRGKPTSYERHMLARYLSKYITKDLDDCGFELGKRRYWSSKNIAKPLKKRYFSATSTFNKELFTNIFESLLGVPIKKYFHPDQSNGATMPIIWMSTG